MRDALCMRSLYIADLDAIEGSTPDLATYTRLVSLGLDLLIDSGARDVGSAAALLTLGSRGCTIVAGLETLSGPCALGEIVGLAGANRVLFSLDLDHGRPRMPARADWASDDPFELAREAFARGVRQLLVLDLARVGMGCGPGTDSLIARIRQTEPRVDLLIGGGISRVDELIALRKAGVAAVLIGSALHDGRIGARELAQFERDRPPASTG
jgi:phosphoribosylformimino-5-aminoimidazole carboxamide ribotide isomerase